MAYLSPTAMNSDAPSSKASSEAVLSCSSSCPFGTLQTSKLAYPAVHRPDSQSCGSRWQYGSGFFKTQARFAQHPEPKMTFPGSWPSTLAPLAFDMTFGTIQVIFYY